MPSYKKVPKSHTKALKKTIKSKVKSKGKVKTGKPTKVK